MLTPEDLTIHSLDDFAWLLGVAAVLTNLLGIAPCVWAAQHQRRNAFAAALCCLATGPVVTLLALCAVARFPAVRFGNPLAHQSASESDGDAESAAG